MVSKNKAQYFNELIMVNNVTRLGSDKITYIIKIFINYNI